jgi:hypothetical protein
VWFLNLYVLALTVPGFEAPGKLKILSDLGNRTIVIALSRCL